MPDRLLTRGLNMRKRCASGTTLIEVLVVIVVFLVGILGLVQVFPPGLAILRTTRSNTIATNLARAEMQRLQAQPNQIAELIAPVSYSQVAGGARFVIDPTRSARDLMPPRDADPGVGLIDSNGNVLLGGNVVGNWQKVSGANTVSRVIGERRPVPAPSVLAGGAEGSVVNLQFGPIYYWRGSSGIADNGVLLVYGNDYVSRPADRNNNVPATDRPARDGEFYFVGAEDTATGDPFAGEDQIWVGPATTRRFRISLSFGYQDGSRDDQYDMIVNVLLDPSSPPSYAAVVGSYWVVSLKQLVAQPDLYGRSLYNAGGFLGAVPDSVRVQRAFDELAPSDSFDPSNPYQYKVWSENSGTILVNPVGANWKVRTAAGARMPLQVSADYTVFDWRIIRDEFRVPEGVPYNHKLTLNSIKIKGNPGPDGVPNPGLGLGAPSALSGTPTVATDVMLLDLDSGGVILGNEPGAPNNSYTVDKSLGVIQFIDVDGDGSNGLSAWCAYPTGDTSNPWGVYQVDHLGGRNLRLLYMGRNEFSVQMYKAANTYRVTGLLSSNGLQVGECYVGGSRSGIGRPNRIYFPLADAGLMVTIGEIWYANGSGRQVLQDQQFQIGGIEPVAGGTMAYVDVTDRVGPGATFDFSNGYAVRRVRGASMRVRVLWNPTSFAFASDEAANYRLLENWMRSWRKIETESFIAGGQN